MPRSAGQWKFSLPDVARDNLHDRCRRRGSLSTNQTWIHDSIARVRCKRWSRECPFFLRYPDRDNLADSIQRPRKSVLDGWLTAMSLNRRWGDPQRSVNFPVRRGERATRLRTLRAFPQSNHGIRRVERCRRGPLLPRPHQPGESPAPCLPPSNLRRRM